MLKSQTKTFIFAFLLTSFFPWAAYSAADFTTYSRELIGITKNGILSGSLAEKWKRGNHYLTADRRQVITNFSLIELTEAASKTETVFYPFGGPDALYPHFFFPHMKTLILVGIENVGSLPAYEQLPQQSVVLKEIMGTLFDHTFYHTNKMSADQEASPANANFTKILASLALLDAKIDRVSTLNWNSTGQLVQVGPGEKAGALQITYRLADNHVRNVYYFQQNLGDSTYKGFPSLKSAQSQSFVNFVKARAGYTSFYKAASFMSHYFSFSFINKLNLDYSNYIVQTDTGIPYEKLKGSGEWNISLYGKYKWPKEPFKGSFQQQDLLNDFLNPDGELPFKYCYNFAIDGSHIIYAQKKTPRATPVE